MSMRANKAIEAALSALREERSQLDDTIRALERAIGEGARSGRAPAAPGVRTRRKPKWSPAARKAAAERMRKYWASRKKAKGGASEKK